MCQDCQTATLQWEKAHDGGDNDDDDDDDGGSGSVRVDCVGCGVELSGDDKVWKYQRVYKYNCVDCGEKGEGKWMTAVEAVVDE